MNISNILKSISNPNGGIILLLNKNSNPDKIVKNIINKFNDIKINNLNDYMNLIQINTMTKTLNKNDILEIKNQFSYNITNNEKLKIYYIKNIDNINNFCFNSLLKFLEEPHDNTLGIFTTKNISIIPNTIVSRCQIYSLDSDDECLEKILKFNNLSNNHWVSKTFYDVNEIIEIINNSNFNIINNLYYFFIKTNLDNIKSYWDDFKKLNYKEIEILLNILLLTVDNFKAEQINKIIEEIKFNPIKYLIFNKIFIIMEKNNYV